MHKLVDTEPVAIISVAGGRFHRLVTPAINRHDAFAPTPVLCGLSLRPFNFFVSVESADRFTGGRFIQHACRHCENVAKKLISSPASSAAEVPQAKMVKLTREYSKSKHHLPMSLTDGRQSIWLLTAPDAERINCSCGSKSTIGRTPNGGAPFFYECLSCLLEQTEHDAFLSSAILQMTKYMQEQITREHLLFSCPRGHQWASMRFINSFHPQSPNCPLCGLTWCNVVDDVPSSK